MMPQQIGPQQHAEAIAPPPENIQQAPQMTCCQKIWMVVKVILFIAVATTLFIVNSTLFLVGCLVGIVWSEQMDRAIQRIIEVWKKQPWIGTLIIVGMVLLSVPMALATSCFFVGARLGSYAYNFGKHQQILQPLPQAEPHPV